MDFSSEILFFFGALGAFNGVLIASYFILFAKPRSKPNMFLGLFLLMLSIRTGKSLFYYYTSDLADIFLHFALTAFFFIGPFLFFYVQSVMKNKINFLISRKTHFFILLPIVLVLGIVYTYSGNLNFWRNLIVDFIYMQWLIYTILSLALIFPLFKKIRSREKKILGLEVRVLAVFVCNVFVLSASLIGHFSTYIIGALAFSLITYLVIVILIVGKRMKPKVFGKVLTNSKAYISSADASILIGKLDYLMKKEELYKKNQLKSVDIANKLDISVHQLSELINVHLEKNLSTLLNEYRVEHAKVIIDSNSNYTLEAIGYECGFNSRSSFYNAFKKITGTSPSQYYNR